MQHKKFLHKTFANFKENAVLQATRGLTFSTTVTFLEDKLLVFLIMNELHAQARQIYLSISDKLLIESQLLIAN